MTTSQISRDDAVAAVEEMIGDVDRRRAFWVARQATRRKIGASRMDEITKQIARCDRDLAALTYASTAMKLFMTSSARV
jgi:hypothetical protein